MRPTSRETRDEGSSLPFRRRACAGYPGPGSGRIRCPVHLKKFATIIQEKKAGLAGSDLTAIRGIGPAKAYQLLAAFELARRHLIKDTVRITKAEDALPLLTDIISKQQEHFVCISLNGANEVIEKRVVTIGSLGSQPGPPSRSLCRCHSRPGRRRHLCPQPPLR